MPTLRRAEEAKRIEEDIEKRRREREETEQRAKEELERQKQRDLEELKRRIHEDKMRKFKERERAEEEQGGNSVTCICDTKSGFGCLQFGLRHIRVENFGLI